MLRGEIDIAVHSSKDLPTLLPEGICHRRLSDPRGPARRADLGEGRRRSPGCRRAARSAPRRCAGRRRSSGCGPTFRSGCCAATSRRGSARPSAARSTRRCSLIAGLKRLGLAHRATALLDDRRISAGRRAGRDRHHRAARRPATLAALAPILDAATGEALACERAFLAVLDGSCKTPIAGHARREGGGVAVSRRGLSRRRLRGVRGDAREGAPADAARDRRRGRPRTAGATADGRAGGIARARRRRRY